MATRAFKRDTRGRFAAVEGRTGAKKKMTKEQREAAAAQERVDELRQDRALEKANKMLDSAEAAVKDADAAWKKLKRKGGGDADYEHAWDQRQRAAEKLARAMKQRAKFQ